MFGRAFLGQVPIRGTSFHLAGPSLGYDPSMPRGLGQFGPCDTLERFMQQVAQSIADANKYAQQAAARGDDNGVKFWADQANKDSKEWEMWKKRYDDCLRAQPVSPVTPVTPEPPKTGEGPRYYPYPVTYPQLLPSELPPPVPTVEEVPTPEEHEQGYEGLPCPEGQYRPPGGGWCVPKPVATPSRGMYTVPYGSLFSGGFGAGGGVSAGSFT